MVSRRKILGFYALSLAGMSGSAMAQLIPKTANLPNQPRVEQPQKPEKFEVEAPRFGVVDRDDGYKKIATSFSRPVDVDYMSLVGAAKKAGRAFTKLIDPESYGPVGIRSYISASMRSEHFYQEVRGYRSVRFYTKEAENKRKERFEVIVGYEFVFSREMLEELVGFMSYFAEQEQRVINQVKDLMGNDVIQVFFDDSIAILRLPEPGQRELRLLYLSSKVVSFAQVILDEQARLK